MALGRAERPTLARPSAETVARAVIPARSVLAPLLLAVLVLGSAWALLSPPFQAPDETTHFAYAQTLAERGTTPGDPGRATFSTEQRLAQDAAGTDRAALALPGRTTWSPAVEARWRAAQARLPEGARGDGGGPNPASLNPPLYYAYGALPYLAASGGDIFDRLHLMRLASALLALVTVAGTWLLAGEVFGRDRVRQLAAAGTVGLLPMVTFVSASFNPDALLWALTSLALWLGVRVMRRGLELRSGVALIAVAALAVATKPVFLALAPALGLAAVVSLRRRGGAREGRETRGHGPAPRQRGGPRGLVVFAVGAVGLAAAAVLGVAAGALSGRVDPRIFASYLWQFYLPRLPFQRDFPASEGLQVYEVWIKTGWGAFGWFEARLPEPVYVALAVGTVLVAVAAVVALVRARRRLDGAVLSVLLLAALSLLLVLHLVEASSISIGQGAIAQGRYLLPLAPLAGLAVAAGLGVLPAPRRPLALGALLGGLVSLQLLSLAVVADRFYA